MQYYLEDVSTSAAFFLGKAFKNDVHFLGNRSGHFQEVTLARKYQEKSWISCQHPLQDVLR